jgi:glycosyltransferase involved in cell wall biosynthesis
MKICFVVAPQNVHWVLDRIAKEIGERMIEDEVSYCYDLENIPEADKYFVTHYSLLPKVFLVAKQPNKQVIVLFTHESVPIRNLAELMNLCFAVVCENSIEFTHLTDNGINSEILHMVPEGADNVKFRPHQRTNKGVLISSACYPRKNPETLLEVMWKLPEVKFTVVGKGWGRFPSNVTYYDNLDYEKYQDIYNSCDVFLSCARLEGGGPAGLIEAMHCNMFPVVSDTGNAREYIVNDYNGFIFPINATPDRIAELVMNAYKMHPEENLPYNDIWQTIQHYTWNTYAGLMKEIINGTTDHSDSQALSN